MMEIPKPGTTVSTKDAIAICNAHGKTDLARRLQDNLDRLPAEWIFDGCSCWYQTWRGHPVYQVCFWHDVAYLIGGDEAMRLEADLELALGLVRMTRSVDFAEITLAGVRIGGAGAWRKNFSWGYGQKAAA